jgi:hypothetical protein
MVHSPYAVEVALPKDLADMFSEKAIEPAPARSALLTLFADGTAAASTAITFLQGPPTVTYWVNIVKSWLHRKRDDGVGEIRLKGPNGIAVFTVTKDTDLAELAGTLHTALFPNRTKPTRDIDDIAL